MDSIQAQSNSSRSGKRDISGHGGRNRQGNRADQATKNARDREHPSFSDQGSLEKVPRGSGNNSHKECMRKFALGKKQK